MCFPVSFGASMKPGRAAPSKWWSGEPERTWEFLHVDDLADACYHLVQTENPPDWVNLGTGTDLTIRELAELVKEVVGYEGRLVFDTSKPDGTPRKLLDVSTARQLGWTARIPLREGIAEAYRDFLQGSKSDTARL